MFSRVLIANRGEIAVRIERTLRRLGIESVAVYSDADAGAPHVRGADRSLRIGPTPARESYLDAERVIDAALRGGAEAVHPGYGFLSESPEFARACADAGLTFIGPGAEAMALLGDKVAAKAAAEAAGVPILPGLSGERLSDEEILEWAASAELPLLLKAAAGGGGKGMRVVTDLDALPEAIGAARREAEGAFGDDRLLVERYLEASRHIEVQIVGDSHGNVVHLGERECSLQRRHQKVIEESPSPVVDPALRERMGAAAVALAREAGYVNAGTVELIAERDDPGAFFFLEVNARLQVEHPVTEAVTGLDLVELQLRVAAGEPLGFGQEDVRMDGHAAEARIYAEDPAHGFLPSAGQIAVYGEPTGLRVDSGVEAGTEIGTDYDPMLAKVVAHGRDRKDALGQLGGGLARTRVLGPVTNVAFLQALLARPEVREGAIDTGLIERLGSEVTPPAADPVLAAAALGLLIGPPPSDDPWDDRDGWRQSGAAWLRGRLSGPDGEVDVAIRRANDRQGWEWQAGTDSGVFIFEAHEQDDEPGWLVSEGISRRVESYLFEDERVVWLLDGAAEPARFEWVEAASGAGARSAGGSLEAPMPGVVIDVRSEPGAAVQEGDVLVVLESMKMELSVQAPRTGVVTEVSVSKGEQVARGQTLIALASEEEAG
ncbi:MAG TPA: biotin carboxylase N-terminal domain-containing protein [Solirubrobacterales bacterium]|nr:biotin carboxylase N-terminal domain-containing protein [Solirubrobacterales bacterium]